MSAWLLIIVSLIPNRDAYTTVAHYQTQQGCEEAKRKELVAAQQLSGYVQWAVMCVEVRGDHGLPTQTVRP